MRDVFLRIAAEIDDWVHFDDLGKSEERLAAVTGADEIFGPDVRYCCSPSLRRGARGDF